MLNEHVEITCINFYIYLIMFKLIYIFMWLFGFLFVFALTRFCPALKQTLRFHCFALPTHYQQCPYLHVIMFIMLRTGSTLLYPFCVCPSSIVFIPPNTKMEPESHNLEKENHLPNHHFRFHSKLSHRIHVYLPTFTIIYHKNQAFM